MLVSNDNQNCLSSDCITVNLLSSLKIIYYLDWKSRANFGPKRFTSLIRPLQFGFYLIFIVSILPWGWFVFFPFCWKHVFFSYVSVSNTKWLKSFIRMWIITLISGLLADSLHDRLGDKDAGQLAKSWNVSSFAPQHSNCFGIVPKIFKILKLTNVI